VGWNRYAYVENNPIRYTDPSGHCIVAAGVDTVFCAGIIIAGVAFVAYSAYVVTSPTFQDALRGAIHSIPSLPLPPFQLPGFNEGVEPVTGGNICQPNLSDQPLPAQEEFPLPDITGTGPLVNSPPRVNLPPYVTAEKTPITDPQLYEPVRGSKAKRNRATGEIWYPDLKHKNHWEVYKNKKDFETGKRNRAVWDNGELKQNF
jgi:hypothetical protein